jgi:restriction system protein
MKLTDVARASLSKLRGDYEIFILDRAMNMLKSQIAAQGKAFEETGGFHERLTAKRIEAREGQRNAAAPSPDSPLCAQPMRQRKSAKGDFLGCSDYPECKGSRPV